MTEDFTLGGGGTVFLLTPLTRAAQDWIELHLAEAQRLGDGVAIEHRYVIDILRGIADDGRGRARTS